MRIPELAGAPTIVLTPAAQPPSIDARSVARTRRMIAAVDELEVREIMVDEYRRREQRRHDREEQRGRPRPVQCFSCKRCWKSRPSSPCTRCGDDPVTRTAHMDPTREDRLRFDDSYYGERVL